MVLVVDDHPELRWILCEIVAHAGGMTVVGQACSGEAALEAADRLEPQLVIMDVSMPGIGGLEATRRLTRGHPSAVVLLVSVDDVSLDVARSSGAAAFVRKQRLTPATLRELWQAHAPTRS